MVSDGQLNSSMGEDTSSWLEAALIAIQRQACTGKVKAGLVNAALRESRRPAAPLHVLETAAGTSSSSSASMGDVAGDMVLAETKSHVAH